MNLRIILADDHPFVLLGSRSTLETCEDLAIVGEALTPTALLALLRGTPCDVLVIDLSMPEPRGQGGVVEEGIGLIRRIRRDWPALRVLVVTGQTNGAILRTVAADSAVSLLGKTDSLDELPHAIRECARGVRYLGRSVAAALALSHEDDKLFLTALLLSKRQTEILRRLVSGESIGEIAAALGCNRRTVTRQKQAAMAHLGVSDDPALFACVRTCGMLFSDFAARR
ncbi:response regulator [Paraburkholderia antibiotica]|uniref:Response regulator transcription factor n=1 Tax=Paraburkholderia antibiotica TaxID=2728839 RepID=A0A7X9X364_9BURK|nr:response regulator transcription factor [Paraburkholderia antibiotica]NML30598.1 response regulator transcription factor [Paraburkholderia antibiotica]